MKSNAAAAGPRRLGKISLKRHWGTNSLSLSAACLLALPSFEFPCASSSFSLFLSFPRLIFIADACDSPWRVEGTFESEIVTSSGTSRIWFCVSEKFLFIAMVLFLIAGNWAVIRIELRYKKIEDYDLKGIKKDSQIE